MIINLIKKKYRELSNDAIMSDIADFDCFPENYNEYIERLDFAILAYTEGDLLLVRDDRFDLKRNK